MEGMEDITEEHLTVKSIAKLSDSEMVLMSFCHYERMINIPLILPSS